MLCIIYYEDSEEGHAVGFQVGGDAKPPAGVCNCQPRAKGIKNFDGVLVSIFSSFLNSK